MTDETRRDGAAGGEATEPTPAAPFWNPYVAGVALGLLLLLTFLLFGWGLGSSSGPTRAAFWLVHAVAPAWAEGNGYIGPYFAGGSGILADWMVFEVVGVFLGGLVGAYSAGRLRGATVDRGPRASVAQRLFFAFLGGLLMGFAARWARGCTSGQALTGGAALAIGSWVFMMAVFAGGYLTAPFIRRQWR